MFGSCPRNVNSHLESTRLVYCSKSLILNAFVCWQSCTFLINPLWYCAFVLFVCLFGFFKSEQGLHRTAFLPLSRSMTNGLDYRSSIGQEVKPIKGSVVQTLWNDTIEINFWFPFICFPWLKEDQAVFCAILKATDRIVWIQVATVINVCVYTCVTIWHLAASDKFRNA